MAWDNSDTKKFNKGFNEIGGWSRIVNLERAVFGEENPKNTENSRIDAHWERISEILSRLVQAEEKIRRLQSMEEKCKELEEKNAELEKNKAELQHDKERLNKELKEEKNKVSSLTERSEEYKDTIRFLEKKNAEYEGKINALTEKHKGEIEFLTKTHQNEIESLKKDHGSEIDSLKKDHESEIDSLKKDHESEIDFLKKEYEDKIDSLTNKYVEEVNSLQDSRETFRADLMKTSEELSEANGMLKRREEELEDTQKQLNDTQKLKTAYVDRFGDWDKTTHDYQELMRCLYKCPSLDGMVEAYGMEKELEGEDVHSVIRFIGMLGNQTTFLPILYEFLEIDKQTNRTFLSEEEIEFINALNNYYRKTFGVNFDFLQFPERNSKFDKNSMSDLVNRGKLYRTVEGVYVPAIMRDAATYLKMALVKGN